MHRASHSFCNNAGHCNLIAPRHNKTIQGLKMFKCKSVRQLLSKITLSVILNGSTNSPNNLMAALLTFTFKIKALKSRNGFLPLILDF